MDFKGRVALVSGGSRGIGRACCLELARRGADVAFTYLGNLEAAEQTRSAIEALGVRARTFQLDVADAEACARVVEQVVEAFGRVDVVVNNAGVHHNALAVRVKDEDWAHQFAVNVGGAFALARAAVRPMMKQGGGSIVNLASIVGEMGNPGQVVYAATKSALVGMTKTLARELASRNIRVNAVSPGFVETDMTASMPEPARTHWVGLTPMGRLGRPEEVASAVAFLAGDDASFVTGELLRVNGGLLT